MTEGYPNVPTAKRGSPQTAFAAAAAIREKVFPIREKAFTVVAEREAYGATGGEVAEALDLHVSQVRSRLSELEAAGRIVESGRTRMGDCNVQVTVWVIPAYGPPPADDPQASFLDAA